MFRDGPVSLYFNFLPQVPANAQVILEIDGDRKFWTQNRRGFQELGWQAQQSQEAKLIVVYGSTSVPVATGTGPWSVFRLFQQARWVPGNIVSQSNGQFQAEET
jgi:type VI protein secretion system component VasK